MFPLFLYQVTLVRISSNIIARGRAGPPLASAVWKSFRRDGAGSGRHLATTSTSEITKSLDRHNQTVQDISRNVRKFYERKEKFRIFHGSTNSTRPSVAKGSSFVDTSHLCHVLKVDTEKRTALVEPNVSMDRLVEETLKYGLVPPVVMEFPGITVGGGYAGTSGESSSFKHGFFNETMNYVEMVLANGEVITCSDKEKSDLFHGAAGAVGTMGVTTLVELRLQPAQKYVETTYHPVSTVAEAIEKIEHMTKESTYDYIDGILFSKNSGAIITGRLTDSPEQDLPIKRFSNAEDPWFYLHVKDTLAKRTGPTTEAIPLAEYLFRYDRGGFWVGASAFEYFGMPFTDFTRWWLDDFLHTRMMYTALHASGQSKRYVVQDLALPYSTAGEFIDYTHDSFGIYPLWLCPLRALSGPTLHPQYQEPDKPALPMLNIGLWGYGPAQHDLFVALNRNLEDKLRQLGGRKWLYAHTYYTEDEFWSIYDRKWYEALRAKYDATSLPSVYEKVKIDVNVKDRAAANTSLAESLRTAWPFAGLHGIKTAIDSKSYLQARKSSWKSSEVPGHRFSSKFHDFTRS